jgi:ribosomal protein S18 acetylase RimI-like enzyme
VKIFSTSKEQYLVPYNKKWDGELRSWIINQKDLQLWSGKTFHNGFSSTALEKHRLQKNLFCFALSNDNNHLLAYGELVLGKARSCTLCRVIVRPKDRGIGIGKRFCSLLINAASKQLNCRVLALNVLECNKPALACYQSLGFKVDRIQPKARLLGNAMEHLVCMSLKLSPIS